MHHPRGRDQEKSDVWPSLVKIFAPYDAYQRKTSRDIPVVRLHPTDERGIK
ncbi:nitroreductase/quinone reductase family protein [Actinoallomurus sp. NPDC052308]|uniref:nitroreductase/quinone reductase family protein n=1 Tax=Actinoallomurus sp. NPDC052308 TaxID=3155530 RepID=UPI00341434E2